MGIVRQIGAFLDSNTWLGPRARVVREWVLKRRYGSGMPVVVNGLPILVVPRYRSHFPRSYDPSVAAYLRARVRPGMTCVSVGANLGLYPIQFAAWTGPTGAVHAFEPNPETVEALRTHLRMNRLTERVRIHPMALADHPGVATFHAAGVDGMSRLGNPNPMLLQTQTFQVQVETLDAFLTREAVTPEVLVADVEGFEAAVLRGGRRLFGSPTPPITVVEMHPTLWADARTDRDQFATLLDELGLRIVPLSGQADPFAEYGHVALERGCRSTQAPGGPNPTLLRDSEL